MPLVRRDPPGASSKPGTADALASLQNGSSDERLTAVRALMDQPNSCAAMGAALGSEPDRRVREAIFVSLVRSGGEDAAQALMPYLRSEEAALRTGALDALATMPDAIGRHLPDLLADPDQDVRLLSCELARRQQPAEATRLLCDLLDRDVEPNVCAAAAEVLAEVGEPEAEAALARCADRFPDAPFLRFAIKTAIARLAAARG